MREPFFLIVICCLFLSTGVFGQDVPAEVPLPLEAVDDVVDGVATMSLLSADAPEIQSAGFSRATCFQPLIATDSEVDNICSAGAAEAAEGSDGSVDANSSRRMANLREICESDGANQRQQDTLRVENNELLETLDRDDDLDAMIELAGDPAIQYAFSRIAGQNPPDFRVLNNRSDNEERVRDRGNVEVFEVFDGYSPHEGLACSLLPNRDHSDHSQDCLPEELSGRNCDSRRGVERLARDWARHTSGEGVPTPPTPSLSELREYHCSSLDVYEPRSCPSVMPADEYEGNCEFQGRENFYGGYEVYSYQICGLRPQCEEDGDRSRSCRTVMREYNACDREVERANAEFGRAREEERSRIEGELRTKCLESWRIRARAECLTARARERTEYNTYRRECRAEAQAAYDAAMAALSAQREEARQARDTLRTELNEEYLGPASAICYGKQATFYKVALCDANPDTDACREVAPLVESYNHLPESVQKRQLEQAKAVLSNVRRFYANLLTEPQNEGDPSRLDQCVAQVGIRATCERLDQDYQRNVGQYQAIYTEERMATLEAMQTEMRQKFERVFQRLAGPPTNMPEARLNILRGRLANANVRAPESPTSLHLAHDS